MVPSLILCCGFGSVGGDLLKESEDAEGGRDGGFVEEGYDIEGFVLQNGLDPCCESSLMCFG